ncbi:MAG: hypothetical protein QOI11_1833, partial [Candidatus Eremiobacteraeota bacterium]|nr:hypothetical protein [Candidatus Eremiobacteraeota bacterium]
MSNRSDDAALQALGDIQRTTHAHHNAVSELLAIWRAANEPPLLSFVELDAATPSRHFETSETFRSLSVYNPTPAPLFLGFQGAAARASSRALSVPPTS